MQRSDIHQQVTDQIVRMLESAEGTFEMPWRQSGTMQRPLNAVTGQRYRGINVLSLWASAIERGYSSGHWASFKQWASIGAQVRKGERGSFIVYYKPLHAHEPDGESDCGGGQQTPRSRGFVLRTFVVFAAEQVIGYEPAPYPLLSLADRLAHADCFVANTGATIRHGGEEALYRPSTDTIHMPNPETFLSTASSSATEGYYGVLLHELVHWTGAPHRCGRDLSGRFGSCSYGMEELVAELGSAFLCADLAISASPHASHAHYLRSWLKVIKNDKRAIFHAAAKASEAAAFLDACQPSDHTGTQERVPDPTLPCTEYPQLIFSSSGSPDNQHSQRVIHGPFRHHRRYSPFPDRRMASTE